MAKLDLLTKEEVKKWQTRIERSRVWREPEEKKWKKYIRYARGKFFEVSEEGDQIAVNLVHPHVRIIIPAIYSKNPDILVEPRRKDAIDAARVMQQLLRYLVKELNLKGEMKTCLLDAILMGHAWIKVGYQTIFETVEKKPLIEQALQMLNKMVSGESVEDEVESTFAVEPDERIVSERPWAVRVSPFDMFVPSFTSTKNELPWITQQLVRRVEDVKKHPDYKNNKNIKPSSSAAEILQERSALNKSNNVSPDEFDEYVTLYEIWDCTENKIYMIADDNEGCLQVKNNVYASILDSRHCFEMLAFNNIPDQFYPISEIEPWEPQLHELNDIRTQMSKHRKKMNRRYIYTEGDLTPSAIDLLKSGEDGACIPTTAEDARTAVSPVQDAALSNDVYAAEQRVKEDITNIGGITDYQKGSASAGAKTATEASIVESQSRFRSEERLDVVGDFAGKIIASLAQISQKFMDVEAVKKILGDDAGLWKTEVEDKAIQGEFSFEIIYGSTAAINRDVDRQQYIQMYGMISQDPMFDPIKVRVELLRKFDHRDVESWMRPDIAAMLKQAELQAISDAMVGGGGGATGVSSGGGASGASPQSSDMMGGIRRALAVRTPGGVGGGTMTPSGEEVA
jgi:hypothetical protein